MMCGPLIINPQILSGFAIKRPKRVQELFLPLRPMINNLRICHKRTNTAELAQEFADLWSAEEKKLFACPPLAIREFCAILQWRKWKSKGVFCIDQEIGIKRNTTYSKAQIFCTAQYFRVRRFWPFLRNEGGQIEFTKPLSLIFWTISPFFQRVCPAVHSGWNVPRTA